MGTAAIVRGAPSKGICRCLFDRPTAAESAETSARFRRINELAVAEASRKYGFDFRQGAPIRDDPRWSWQKASETDPVAAAGRPTCRTDEPSSDDSQPPQGDQTSIVMIATGENRDHSESNTAVVSLPIVGDDSVENSPADRAAVSTASLTATATTTTNRKRAAAKTMTGL